MGINTGVQWWWTLVLRSGGKWLGRCRDWGAVTPGVFSFSDTPAGLCGQAVAPEKRLLAIGPSWCILYTCKEQVKFILLSRDGHRRGVTDKTCSTVQMSPSHSEQAAVCTQPGAVLCGDGRCSLCCGWVQLMPWERFLLQGPWLGKSKAVISGVGMGSTVAWEIHAAAQSPLLHKQACSTSCFASHPSCQSILSWNSCDPYRRVCLFLDTVAACERLSEHVCYGTCSTELSGALGSVFGLLRAALGWRCTSGLPKLLGFLSLRLDFNGFYTERLERMSAERSQKAAPLLPCLAVPAQWSPAAAPFSRHLFCTVREPDAPHFKLVLLNSLHSQCKLKAKS